MLELELCRGLESTYVTLPTNVHSEHPHTHTHTHTGCICQLVCVNLKLREMGSPYGVLMQRKKAICT